VGRAREVDEWFEAYARASLMFDQRRESV